MSDPARLQAVAAVGLLDTAPEAAFDDLAALAGRLVGAPFAFVTLVDEHRSFWKSRIGIPIDGPVQNPVDESFCQYVIASAEPLIAGDVTADPLTAGNPSIASMGVRAWAGFPLLAPDGQPLGSFCVVDTVVRQWSDSDVETLRVLSAAASRELALRSSVRKAALANSQLTLLARVGQALTGTLDPDDAVARLAQLVIPVLGDWSLVSLADEDGTLRDVSWWHGRAEARPLLDGFAGERLVGLGGGSAAISAQRSRRPVVLNDGALEAGLQALASPPAREAYRALNPGSYGVWPLVFGDTVHGVLVIARDAGSATFTSAESELAANIAQGAGAVLDNARLYTRQQAIAAELAHANQRLREAALHDHVVARALQDAMLSRIPQPDHLQVATRYLTADLHDQVGGDWYDALLPPDGATTLMIGDVAGHDIAAASVMGQLRNLLRAFAWEHDDEPPSALIARLDHVMTDLGVTTMTTLMVARIEQGKAAAEAGQRVLRWSCAGHPAPILIDADGTPTLLTGRPDPPLAVLPGVERRDHLATIGPGQTLLMYTDGLIEDHGQDIVARQLRLLQVLSDGRELGLDDLVDSVLRDMVGKDPDDDVALVAVRFHPEDRPRPPEAGPATD
ncbi:MAG: GAF domain-containing SpoIIE family protein phosphatase [Jatrophihabitans sp.]